MNSPDNTKKRDRAFYYGAGATILSIALIKMLWHHVMWIDEGTPTHVSEFITILVWGGSIVALFILWRRFFIDSLK